MTGQPEPIRTLEQSLFGALALVVVLGIWTFSFMDEGFWVRLPIFSTVLAAYALYHLRGDVLKLLVGDAGWLRSVFIGCASAALFYLVTRVGYEATVALAPDIRPLVERVYALARDVPFVVMAASLLVVASLEEVFWRGWIILESARLFPRTPRAPYFAVFLVSLVYGGMHLFSRNPLLAAMAFAAAAFWGLLFLRYRSLIACAVSHICWDFFILRFLPLVDTG